MHCISGIVIVGTPEILQKLRSQRDIKFCKLNAPYVFIDTGERSILFNLGVTQAAYVETDYFGGSGTQHGDYLQGGEWKFCETINEALQKGMGVEPMENADQFDVVGLGGIRSSEDVNEEYNAQFGADLLKEEADGMSTMDQLWDATVNHSNLAGSKSLENVTIKLGEEFGEVCAEVLKLNGYKKSGQTYEETQSNLREESVDLFITLIDWMNKLGMTKEELYKIFPTKLDKWKNKHLLPNLPNA